MERTVSAGAMDSDNIALKETAKGDTVALTRKAAEGMAGMFISFFSFFFFCASRVRFLRELLSVLRRLLFYCCWYEQKCMNKQTKNFFVVLRTGYDVIEVFVVVVCLFVRVRFFQLHFELEHFFLIPLGRHTLPEKEKKATTKKHKA